MNRPRPFIDPECIAESTIFWYGFCAFEFPMIDPRGGHLPGSMHQSYQLEDSLFRFFNIHGQRDILDFRPGYHEH